MENGRKIIRIAPGYSNYCFFHSNDVLLPENILVRKAGNGNRPAGFSAKDWISDFRRPKLDNKENQNV